MEKEGDQAFSVVSALESVRRLTEKKMGPPRSFGCGHLVLALLTIQELRETSRGNLASRLGLGGGAIKTLVATLREGGLVETKRRGNVLTPKGEQMVSALKKFFKRVSPAELEYLKMGEFNAVIVVDGRPLNKVDPLRLRDVAVSKGATGLTTLTFGEDLEIPPDGIGLKSVSKVDYERLMSFGVKRGDVVFVCGSSSVASAERIGIEVALEAALNRRTRCASRRFSAKNASQSRRWQIMPLTRTWDASTNAFTATCHTSRGTPIGRPRSRLRSTYTRGWPRNWHLRRSNADQLSFWPPRQTPISPWKASTDFLPMPSGN